MSADILTAEDIEILAGIGPLTDRGDVEGMRAFIQRHPALIRKRREPGDRGDVLWYRLYYASMRGQLDLVKLYVEYGADINITLSKRSREGVIESAAGNGHLELMRWLLDQGAIFQQELDGRMTSLTLIHSALSGQLAEVELLLDRGAPINGLSYNGKTALDFAVEYGHTAVADFLRARGALEGWKVLGEPEPEPEETPETLAAHLEETLGAPAELSLRELMPADAPITIRRVVGADEQFLVTDGMSAAALTPLDPTAASAFAEVYVRLPADWPLTAEALADPLCRWPIEVLRQVARLPHDGPFWLDPDGALITTSDPETTLSPDTRQCALLAVLGGQAWDEWERPDGEAVRLFLLFPIYPEERALAERDGIRALLELFDAHQVPLVVDPHRPSVAIEEMQIPVPKEVPRSGDAPGKIAPRLRYLLALSAVVFLGLASRLYPLGWYFWDRVLGEVLYAVAAYLALALLLFPRPPWLLAGLAFGCCLAVEFFKLTGIPAANQQVFLVRWFLGSTFAWVNLAYYLSGAVLSACADTATRTFAGRAQQRR